MTDLRRAICTVIAVLALGILGSAPVGAQRGNDDRKPSIALKLTPPVGFAPLKVRVVVDLRGGADDYAEFYCPNIQWDWADGTISESGEDCNPYEAGKSTIKRRFSAEHTYRQSGSYQIYFRMKQKDKVVATGSATVQVRAGLREDFDQ